MKRRAPVLYSIVLLTCGCTALTAGRRDSDLFSPDALDPAHFVCEVCVERVRGVPIDTLRAIGIARNISSRPIDLCGRFDFGGGYKPCSDCPPAERPPTLWILPESWRSETPFGGRGVHLAPGAELRDTLIVTFRPLDFEFSPGKITLEGSFWAGKPGGTFADARCLDAEAGTIAVEVP